MKRLIAALILIGCFSISISAGQIPTDDSPTPPPSGSNQTTNAASSGDIPSVGSLDPMSEAAVSALLIAFGLASI